MRKIKTNRIIGIQGGIYLFCIALKRNLSEVVTEK